MQSAAKNPEQYFQELPEERKDAMLKLRQVIKKNLPKGLKNLPNIHLKEINPIKIIS
jgi:hypothetical protein